MSAAIKADTTGPTFPWASRCPSSFETVMPNTIAQFDDETQAIEATKSDATDLTAGGRGVARRRGGPP